MNHSRQLAQAFQPGSEFLDSVNPLKVAESPVAEQLSTPGGVISRVLQFAIPIAGLILFVMILWGGFDIVSGAAGKKGIEEGRKKITTALIGFFLIFGSYWIVQILQAIFGFKVI